MKETRRRLTAVSFVHSIRWIADCVIAWVKDSLLYKGLGIRKTRNQLKCS